MEQKVIAKVEAGAHGHLHVDFEDHSKVVLHRGTHEAHDLKPGDLWPPDEPVEAASAGDDDDYESTLEDHPWQS